MRLHKKAKSLDTYLDDRSEPSSVRKVWAEIRDGVERGVVLSYKMQLALADYLDIRGTIPACFPSSHECGCYNTNIELES